MDLFESIERTMNNRSAFPDDITREELNDKLLNLWADENFFKSQEYTSSDIKENNGSPFTFESKAFNKIGMYMAYALDRLDNWRNIESNIEKELRKYDAEGLLCLYSSVVHLCLLYEFGMDKSDLKLVQGYYDFFGDDSVSPFATQVFGNRQVGLHAWTKVKDCVVDFTIISQRKVVRLPTPFGILGEVGNSVNLVGVEEDFSVVKKYARRLAKENGQTYYEWINSFKDEVIDVVSKANLTND